MTYCHVSRQIDDHAHWLGIEQARECAIESLMMENLRIANRYLNSLGRRHCRLGIKPLAEQEDYLDGYSHQYVKENTF